MKKVLLLIIAVVSVTQAYAQVDSMKVESPVITVDSLLVRVNKLQHDYNFMSCDYELTKLKYDLSDFTNSTDISANRIVNNFYHGEYDSSLYSASLEEYKAKSLHLDSIKKKIEAVKLLVVSKMLTSDFSDKEHEVLLTSFDVIEKSVKTAENSLSYYDIALQAFNSLGKRRR